MNTLVGSDPEMLMSEFGNTEFKSENNELYGIGRTSNLIIETLVDQL